MNMNKKSILSYVAFFGGMALLIACLSIWKGEDTPTNVFVLNMIVSVFAYSLFFGNLFLGKAVTKDNDSKIGGWGSKWLTVTLYPVIAVLAIFLLASFPFMVQLMVHLGLLFFLVIAFLTTASLVAKVEQVNDEQKAIIAGVQRMKSAMASVQDAVLDSPELPANYRQKLSEIEQALRFISPSDNPQATDLENKFVQIASEIEIGLPAFAMNKERLENLLLKLERVLNQRKNTYSN